MKRIQQFSKLFVLVALFAAAAPWTTSRTSARQTDSVGRTVNFGSIGVARGQTVRITGLAVAPCNIPAEFVFLDGEGGVIAAQDFHIPPEHFDLIGLKADRLQLRGLVKYTVHAEHIDVERLIPTLEIIDNKTGRTTFGWSVPEPPECPAP
jgi:hypothetical protein